jgi:hypothetical protein
MSSKFHGGILSCDKRNDKYNKAMEKLIQSKEKVRNSFRQSLSHKQSVMSMEEVRKMLTEKLKGESLSQEIIEERNLIEY